MKLKEKIKVFLANPFPLWDTEITSLLVEKEWQKQDKNSISKYNYSSSRSYFKDSNISGQYIILNKGSDPKYSINLEYPNYISLNSFYIEHGLEFEMTYNHTKYIPKIKSALSMLNMIPEIYDWISIIVKSILVLKQDDGEIDTSYSHPEIPFSIFLSLCNINSEIDNFRIVESILHEAMHLKLTLIEKHIDLVVPNNKETFYSPWRGEQRPIKGVLHGIFVFRAIFDLYSKLYIIINNFKSLKYIADRKANILKDFYLLKDFYKNNGLTSNGAILAKNLLPLN